MIRRWRQAARRRPAMGLALLLALLSLRALVPQGWMLDLTPAGALTMRVCDGMAPPPTMATMAMPDGRHHHDPAHQAPDHPCAFAGMAHAAPAPALPLAAPPMPAAAAPLALAHAGVTVGRGLAAPPPPPTGPPAFA